MMQPLVQNIFVLITVDHPFLLHHPDRDWETLVGVRDAKGRTVTDRMFDPDTVEDFEFADGGLARLGYRGGKLVGKALGMFKRQQALERGAGEGFAAAEAYGITGQDVTRLFKELAMDDTLVGAEKTQYMKLVNEVLKKS